MSSASVSLKTFKNWGVENKIGYQIGGPTNSQVVKVWCKTCSKHQAKIKSDLKGKALRDIEKYIEGTTFVTKWNITRHLETKAHEIGIKGVFLHSPLSNHK